MGQALNIALLPGDGIGPEVTAEARRVLEALDLGLTFEEAKVGGAAYEAAGHPLPPETLEVAGRADALLFGAVGDTTIADLCSQADSTGGDDKADFTI